MREQLLKLEEETKDPELTFGSIYDDIKRLISIINKIVDYQNAKRDILDSGRARGLAPGGIVPLFKNMNEPSEDEIGYVIDLKCGHTQRPTDVEAVMFAVHLEAVGFMKGKGNIGSPEREIMAKIKSPSVSVNSESNRKGRKSMTIAKHGTPYPGDKNLNGFSSAGVATRTRSTTIQIKPIGNLSDASPAF